MALYKSAYAALTVLVRPEIPFYHPVTGVETQRVRRLTADFGLYGGEFNAANPLTGAIEEHAVIYGHYYDSEVAAENEEWTDEERASVEAALDKLCREQPYLIAKVELVRPKAEPPWPTYEQTDGRSVAKLAIDLGLVSEALTYERENEAREGIITKLEAWLAENTQPEVETEHQGSPSTAPGMITL